MLIGATARVAGSAHHHGRNPHHNDHHHDLGACIPNCMPMGTTGIVHPFALALAAAAKLVHVGAALDVLVTFPLTVPLNDE